MAQIDLYAGTPIGTDGQPGGAVATEGPGTGATVPGAVPATADASRTAVPPTANGVAGSTGNSSTRSKYGVNDAKRLAAPIPELKDAIGNLTRDGTDVEVIGYDERGLLSNPDVVKALDVLQTDRSSRDLTSATHAQHLEDYSTAVASARAADQKTQTEIQAAKDENSNGDNDSRPRNSNRLDDGECGLSSKISDGKFGCGGTRKMIKANEIMNQAGQMGAAAATQISGAQAQNTALSAGTQSAAIRGAATTQGSAGKAQILLGAMSAMMGMMEMQRGAKHEGYKTQINKGFQAQSNKSLYETRASKDPQFDQNAAEGRLAQTAREKQVEEVGNMMAYHKGSVSRATALRDNLQAQKDACNQQPNKLQCHARVDPEFIKADRDLTKAVTAANDQTSQAGRTLAASAAGEQGKVAQEAKDAGMLAMMQGAQQIGQGALNVAAANQLAQAAKQMEATENNPGLTLTPPGQDSFPTVDPRAPTVITGDGAPPADTSTASQDQQPIDNGASPLGNGLPGPTDQGPAGPPVAAGKFIPGTNAAGGGAGGGAGGLSGGSTQAPGPDGGDKGPTAANPYVAGTTPVSGGGMVGPPPGGSKEAGLSPADMMAQALGLLKPSEKDPTGQAYGGRRGPASGSLNGLGLPEEDIFKIVGDGYRRQIQAGNIGG